MTDFFFRSWAEFFFFVLMVVGFIIGLWAPSAFVSYIVIFLSGMIGGRILYYRKAKLTIPYYIIIMGFLIGFLIGSVYGSNKIRIVLFILGMLLSYHLYNKGYLRDLPY